MKTAFSSIIKESSLDEKHEQQSKNDYHLQVETIKKKFNEKFLEREKINREIKQYIDSSLVLFFVLHNEKTLLSKKKSDLQLGIKELHDQYNFLICLYYETQKAQNQKEIADLLKTLKALLLSLINDARNQIAVLDKLLEKIDEEIKILEREIREDSTRMVSIMREKILQLGYQPHEVNQILQDLDDSTFKNFINRAISREDFENQVVNKAISAKNEPLLNQTAIDQKRELFKDSIHNDKKYNDYTARYSVLSNDLIKHYEVRDQILKEKAIQSAIIKSGESIQRNLKKDIQIEGTTNPMSILQDINLILSNGRRSGTVIIPALDSLEKSISSVSQRCFFSAQSKNYYNKAAYSTAINKAHASNEQKSSEPQINSEVKSEISSVLAASTTPLAVESKGNDPNHAQDGSVNKNELHSLEENNAEISSLFDDEEEILAPPKLGR